MASASIRAFVEVSAGSRTKRRYDEQTLEQLGSATVPVPYPHAYGFVLGTASDDGEAVDCFLIATEPLRPGSIVDATIVGLLEQFEDDELDHKLIAHVAGASPPPPAELHAELSAFISRLFEDVPHIAVRVGELLAFAAAREFLDRHRV